MTDPDPVPSDAQGIRPVLGLLALTALALVALWFCIRAIVLQLAQEEYPLVGQAMNPPSPVSLAIISLNRASAQNGFADPLAWKLSTEALRRAPLLADPFIVAGLDASARDDTDRAERLMEEAKRRSPRAIIPRYWLFDSYLRRGEYAKGVAEVQPLVRAQPAAEPAAVAVLTSLILIPEARPALVAALRDRPVWRRAFFRQAAASPRLRDEATELLSLSTANSRAPASGDQRAIVNALIDAKDYSGAYSFWRRTVSAGQRPSAPGLYDGSFAGRGGDGPFDWRFVRKAGTVQPVAAPNTPQGSGLAIQVDSVRATLLAEQTVLARPGAATLSFSVRGGTSAGDAGIKLELRCAPTRKMLASMVVDEFVPTLRENRLRAQVPRGCDAVQVRVLSVPGIEAYPLDVLLTGMQLTFGRDV